MTTQTPKPATVKPPVKKEEERPPQQEELRCSICHMPSCSR